MSDDVSYTRPDISTDVAVLSGDQIEAAAAGTAGRSVVVPLFGVTIFLSAALLFAVQPMFTKMVLPRFGGSPSVWSVAMVFFQGILLLGYAYADILTRFVRARSPCYSILRSCWAERCFCRIAIAKGWGLPPADREQMFLLGLFAASIGFPFFALSANGPLLQAWFARSGLGQAENPYFLYAASNIGSLLALFAYPFRCRTVFDAAASRRSIWRSGYYLLIALIALCGRAGVLSPQRRRRSCRGRSPAAAAPRLPSWPIGWRWRSCRRR